MLERLLRQSNPEVAVDASAPGQIHNVPLWVTGWAALPGFQQVIHVDAPAHVHMFAQLVHDCAAAGVPARFGQILLRQRADGEMLAIVPGSRAVGTVMEVEQIHPLQGGRLAVSVRALCRFRVLQPTASTPHARADVVLVPDYEELSEVRNWPGHHPASPALRAEATRAAAAAASLRWAQTELQHVEASGTVGGRMADESGLGAEAPVPLSVRFSMAGARDGAHDAACEAANAVLARAGMPPPFGTGDATSVEPPRAAEASAGEALHQRSDDAADDPLARFFEQHAVEGFAAEAVRTGLRVPRALFSRRGPPAGRAFLLALEHAIWTELISVRTLELRRRTRQAVNSDGAAHGRGADATALSLSDELLQLMPPPPPGGWSVAMPPTPPATEWLRRWEYPPVRRAQRLSYMIATQLPTIDRQRLLQASSVRERLQLSIVALSEMRRRLAAISAIEVNGADGDEPGGLAYGI